LSRLIYCLEIFGRAEPEPESLARRYSAGRSVCDGTEMRHRAIVRVAGPPGSGKTTFIEALRGAADALIHAARCARDDSLRKARDTVAGNHPELRRYGRAGASGAALFAFPRRIGE
jgi:hypothetical protein